MTFSEHTFTSVSAIKSMSRFCLFRLFQIPALLLLAAAVCFDQPLAVGQISQDSAELNASLLSLREMKTRFGEQPGDVPQNKAGSIIAPAAAAYAALTDVFGDRLLGENVASVRKQAKTLAAEEQFQFLSDWVLPGRSRKTFRLNGHFSPLSPAVPIAEYTSEEAKRIDEAEQAGAGRILVGGSLFSAAFDLVETARELGKLDELYSRIDVTHNLESSDDPLDHFLRSRLTMLVLTDIAAQRFDRASEHLLELGEIVKSRPIRDPTERWPEMLAFWEGVRHRETYQTVSEPLFQFVFRDLHGGSGTGSDVWDRQLLALMGFRKIMEAKDWTADDYYRSLPLTQWATAEYDSALNRGTGMPGSRWIAHDHGISQLSGHENDFLYFQCPLRGDYDIDCLTTTFDWRECEMFFNGRWAGPAWGMTHFETGDHRRNYRKPPLGKKMSTETGDWFHVRIQSKDGIGRMLVNGRQFYAEPLSQDHDPWIGGRFWHRYHGGIRDVRITGTPQIPKSLNLLHDRQLTGWADYYDPHNFDLLNAWRFDGEQLTGMALREPVNSHHERLLRYHRPMLEDGVIEYEFYYQPGHHHVHPALDRLTFLLDPGAVRIHWCTDGAFDQTGLAPDNTFDEPENQRHNGALPLKANDWNHLKLQLSGSDVDLVLNGQPVFQRRLESSNMRRFGLFCFPDQTAVRVRKLVWTGDWPTQLPALKDQELADMEFITRLEEEANQLEQVKIDFAGRTSLPHNVRTYVDSSNGVVSEYRPGLSGLRATQQENQRDGWKTQAVVAPFSLAGDFDIVAEFDDLVMSASNNAERFCGINLQLKLVGTPFTGVFFHARRSSDGNLFLDTMTEHKATDGSSRWNVRAIQEETSGGRLRLARRGTRLYYLFANGDSTQFRLCRTQDIPATEIAPESIELQTLTGGVGRASVTWKTLILRGESLSPAP